MTTQTIEERIGYQFANRELLLRALTHPSYVNEHPDEGPDNQRLEFLGDAVLNFAVTVWIFRNYPTFNEGQMTRLRSALVREATLAAFARQVGLGRALRLGQGEEAARGRTRPANLGDGFEALVGALYLDGGIEAVERFLEPMIGPAAQAILSSEADKDPKSRFQEWAQAELGVTPRYRIVAEYGPDHAKTFVAEVLVGEQVAGRGQGHSKQTAEQAAAQEALASLVTDSDTRSEGEAGT